jgi:K(+)-stimulated pyrophosphate-energized sodium pump
MRADRLFLGALLGLILTVLLLLPGQTAAIGGQEIDRSMVRTESGADTFFIESAKDSQFLIDMITDDDKKTYIGFIVLNPDITVPHDVTISVTPPEGDDWEVKVDDIMGDKVSVMDKATVIVEDRSYRIEGMEADSSVVFIVMVNYKGEGDITENLTVEASIDDAKVFSVTKVVELKTTHQNYLFIWIGLGAAVIGLVFAFYTAQGLYKVVVEDRKVNEISGFIAKGARAFLNAEYKVIGVYIVAVVVFLGILVAILDMNWRLIPAFVIGAVFSASAGNIGMRVATMANAKTAWACREGEKAGLKIAFRSGSVMGLTVVGLGLLGVSTLFFIFGDVDMLFGFGFGASSIALFARVGGGIYTKAADVGADLVGKVEKGIPEDDPRNPATIADNVGDNVGDVAGMGADLFESYVDSIIAAMALGIVGFAAFGGDLMDGGAAGIATVLPLLLSGVGIFCAIIGMLFVGSGGEKASPAAQMNMGIWISAVLMAIASFAIIYLSFGDFDVVLALFFSLVAGLVAGIVIGKVTEYYTSDDNKPTQKVSQAATRGAGPNLIAGLGLGMLSTAIPVIAVVVTIVAAYLLSGLYGIALSAVGMLSTLGITLATDTYGPVADNAAGIAEMAGLGKKVRETAERLDAVGNTTAAIGKGFAIGSAALTALALFAAFIQTSHIDISQFSLINPFIVAGLFIGGLLPFLFSALAMNAVGDAAQDMVEEVRRQFKTIKGIMTGRAQPDYERCVAISTQGALKRMIVPSLIAVVVPLVVGCVSLEALGGLLAGSIVTGFVLAVMMANAGGAWDNAKKYIEKGNFGGKGSDAHKNAVVGDTVGDPFKDTAGPSLNILIKLMSIVALLFIPLFMAVNAILG